MPQKLDMKAAIWAGIGAGCIFVLLEMLLVAMVAGDSPWGPPRMMAAIAMGSEVLPPPATFDLAIVTVGMIVHFTLSLLYGLLLGWAITRQRMSAPAAIAAGIVFSLLIYLVNFYGFTSLFPWFAMARNWMTISAHAAYGFTLGWIYHATAGRVRAP